MDKLQEYVAEDLPMGNILKVVLIQGRTMQKWFSFILPSYFQQLIFQ